MEEQKGGLLVVMAHPDDESMGAGGVILRHTRNGIATHRICATYGEARGRGQPALSHLAIDHQVAEFYQEAIPRAGGNRSLPLIAQDQVDVVIELDPDEVMMKLRAIDCHRSQLEDWRIAIRDHPHLMQRGYGHEPYVTVSSRTAGLTEAGLLGEFV